MTGSSCKNRSGQEERHQDGFELLNPVESMNGNSANRYVV